jgi:signal transduction histidine kinase
VEWHGGGTRKRRDGKVWTVQEERRWVVPAGLAVVGLVVLANAAGKVGLGTSGNALVITISVAVYTVTAVVFLLWFTAPRPATIALLLVMAIAATATHHGDPTGTGGIGLYLGVAFAPLRLPIRTSAVVAAISVLLFDVQLLLEAADPGVFVLVVDGGAAFFFFLGVLLRREREQRLQVARLLAELEASREAEKEAAALAERARLAREMHDVLAHTLSGLALQLQGAKALARSLAPRVDTGELVETVDHAHALARDGLAEARQAISALRGTRVPGPEALGALVEEHRLATDTPCRLQVEGVPGELPPDGRLALYRTAQEALSNVRKHAPGAPVDVRLAWEPAAAVLVVEDHAGGPAQVPAERPDGGYGLVGMAERARLLGGDLEAAHTPGGFRVALRLPLQGRAENGDREDGS